MHQVAKTWGYPLQYSVFICDLTDSELMMMKADIRGEMHNTQDSVGIFDLGPSTGRGLKCIDFLGTRRELPDPDAQIW